MIAAVIAGLWASVPMSVGSDQAAALSKARMAVSSAEGDRLPQDGQEGPPDFFPQGRSDIRYVVFQGDGPAGLCVIAQSFDGKRLRRLWKMPTRWALPKDSCGKGTLAVALFKLGYVPLGSPKGAIAKALAKAEGLAGYVFSGPGISRAWFVDRKGKMSEPELIDDSHGFRYLITAAEREALGWKTK